MNYERVDIIRQLAVHEGVIQFPYTDTTGNLTIGIGRNLDSRGISEEECYHLCNNDVNIIEKELSRAHPVVAELDEVRQMVLVDMAFNMGMPTLNGFANMWNAIYVFDYYKAAHEMLDSRWAEQVGQRAITLSDMMRDG
jgi:lysozyme